MSRQYVVLCEDLQSWCFVYRALIESGAQRRNVFPHPYPDSRFHAAGGGSPRPVDGYQVYACGSQHVLMNFPGQLAAVRSRAAKKRDTALVVHLDVDNATATGRTVQDRYRDLDAACAAKSVPARAAADPVAWLVPRREIETWIHALMGTAVDEHTSYPKFTDREADAAPAARAFAVHARASTAPAGAIPSLVTGLAEFRRVV